MKSLKYLSLLILYFLIGCNTEEKLNKEELEIVSTFINKKLLIESIASTVNDEYFKIREKDSTRHYTLDEKSELFEKIENEVSKRTFYIKISDTLFAVRDDYYVHGLIGKDFLNINENFSKIRKINYKDLKIRKNLILIPSNKGIADSCYLGSYKISRVIFGKDERAFIGAKSIIDDEEYFRTMTELKKKNEQWVIKKKWE